MSMKIGFIGTGFMGRAMISGILAAGTAAPDMIYAFDINKQLTGELKGTMAINIANSNTETVQKSDIVILAVKPNYVKSVLMECKESFTEDKILISIAAGITLNTYFEIMGSDKKIIRAMPNLPAAVREGMTLIAYESNITESEVEIVKNLLSGTGKVEVLSEKLMNEVVALTGSSPAYVFIMLEAMADAAVLSGIPRNISYKLAAQAVLGAAKIVLETGKHPGELKDQVCSPSGTTIEAVASLEKNGFRHAIIDAMGECTKKARELGKLYGG